MEMLNEQLQQEFNVVLQKYNQIEQIMSSVEVMSDNKLYEFYRKEQTLLKPRADAVKNFIESKNELDELNELLSLETDETQRQNILCEIQRCQAETENLLSKAKDIFSKNLSFENQIAKIEISFKQGENILDFLKNIFEKFAKNNNFIFEVQKQSDGSLWLKISGNGCYDILKNFTGTVQKTQNGKSSSALIVVINEQLACGDICEDDIEIQTHKSSGAGGQHINKTESAVRVIHIPTGITVSCQDERSQLKNKERAIALLKEKIQQKNQENSEKCIKNQRNLLKNAIFSDTPVLEFDFDKNIVRAKNTKTTFEINEITEGNLTKIFSEINGWY